MSTPAIIGAFLVLIPCVVFAYAYVGYPAVLWIWARTRPVRKQAESEGTASTTAESWPMISISLPAHNEAESIGQTLEHILALDYPSSRLQIVVISDASTDRTDEIVRGYRNRGVALVRCERRGGKTAAEVAALPYLMGDIVVNMDATIRIPRESLKPLIRAFTDPTVGVASGRDISCCFEGSATRAEASYVGYEMWVRQMETQIGGIVGASGCFYAIRRPLHRADFPAGLSRDFASCLIAREQGYRAISVDDAVCLVPRTRSLSSEYRRKVRTMERGLATLWYLRSLMNPLRYGRFAWMLASHKLARWLVWLTWPGSLAGLVLLSIHSPWLWPVTALVGLLLAIGLVGWHRARVEEPSGITSLLAYSVASAIAGFAAWCRMSIGGGSAIWEPTRR